MADTEYNSKAETLDRNTVLVDSCGNLPSYAYWLEQDIDEQTRQERIDWWYSDTIDTNHDLVKKWKDFYKKTQTNTLIYYEQVLEGFCEKRI